MSEHAEIPLKPEEVTSDWLKQVLKKSLKTEVEVVQLVGVETEGFLSKACKAQIKIGPKVEKIFVKITLPAEDSFLNFITDYNIDAMEVKAYKEILPKLIEFERQFNHQGDQIQLKI